MRALLWGLLLAGCAPLEAPPLATTGPVTGVVHVPTGLVGDAWVFLYRPGEGPPGNPAVPVAASAISAQRLAGGDAHFVVSNVKPDPYRLWGLLDVDGNLDLNVDVLSQPTAGDRVASRGVDLSVQPSRGATADLDLDQVVTSQPPACVLDTPNDDVLLDVSASGTTTLTLVADPVGTFDPARTAFSVGLVDADGDGRPDDANGDGTPDLSLTAVLRWKPLPGQLEAGSVVVPLLFNPSPFLGVLQGRLGVRVTADRLQLAMLPTATQLLADGSTQPFGAPPPGDYELLLLSTGGQFWRLPNQLAGRLASQGVRLHVDRKSP